MFIIGVETIDQKVSELHELVPEARIGFVHGQMSEVMLENTLLDFLNGDYDVLVATTIIETGIDISNVNTLFIENADHMGLSTLLSVERVVWGVVIDCLCLSHVSS